MTDAEVFQVVKRALQKYIPSGDETIMDNSVYQAGMTSLMAAQLCVEIGQQLDVQISPADLAKDSTGRDIASIVSKLRSK